LALLLLPLQQPLVLVFPAAEQGKTSRAIPKGLALLLLPLQQPLVFPFSCCFGKTKGKRKTSRAIPKGLALLQGSRKTKKRLFDKNKVLLPHTLRTEIE
jgi:hypothetical protein